MSMFSLPEELMPDVKTFEAKTTEMTALFPRELAGAVNLFVHPLAGAAAASALGIGLASHAFGLWLGAMSGMSAASQLLLSPLDEGAAAKADGAARKHLASTKAKTAAKVLIEEARSTALEIAGPAAKAKPVVRTVEPAAGLHPEDFRQPKSMAKPKKVDDLKAISGIGPKLEKVLNGLGVWTYAQIAAWSPEEIAWVDDYLSFRGRIGRDGWIGQAAKLAGKRGGGKQRP